jgi:hypothetical protein
MVLLGVSVDSVVSYGMMPNCRWRWRADALCYRRWCRACERGWHRAECVKQTHVLSDSVFPVVVHRRTMRAYSYIIYIKSLISSSTLFAASASAGSEPWHHAHGGCATSSRMRFTPVGPSRYPVLARGSPALRICVTYGGPPWGPGTPMPPILRGPLGGP